jgi:hypothetical protein
MTKIGTVDILDRETVEGKIRHYQSVVSNYGNKYSLSYEAFEKSIPLGEANLTSAVEDDLLDWKEALLMLSVYERMLGEMTKTS